MRPTHNSVRKRANNRCEYCLLDQECCELTHHVEHVIAKQHGGGDAMDNLALACHRCNLRKGPNLTGIDPITGELVRLFNPQRDEWSAHFFVHGLRIEGHTSIGRATVKVLGMNDVRRLELRAEFSK